MVPVCLTVKNPDLGLQEMSNSQDLTHSSLAECGSGQAVQAGPDHSDRIVSDSSGLSVDMHQPQIDLFAMRFNKLPLFVSPVADSLAWVVDTLSLP